MKKVIILVIGLIYVASIAVVNFFGLEVQVFEGTTYVSEITVDRVRVLNPDAETDFVEPDANLVNGKKLYRIEFTPAPEGEPYTDAPESIAQNPNAVFLDLLFSPNDADNKKVSFVYDEAATAGKAVFFEEEHTVVFLKPGQLISLTVKAEDGSNVQTSILLLALPAQK